jgi:hypothetical protein
MAGNKPRKDIQKFREIWWHGLSIDMRNLIRQSKETYDCCERRKPGKMVAASMGSYYLPVKRSVQDLLNAAARLKRSIAAAEKKEREMRKTAATEEENKSAE